MRIANFYRPVPPSQGVGPGSVYSQHLNYLNITNRRICPREGFLNNLKEEVDKWKKEGDLILLMGDFNEYILSHRSRQYFTKLGLRVIITEKMNPKVRVPLYLIKIATPLTAHGAPQAYPRLLADIYQSTMASNYTID